MKRSEISEKYKWDLNAVFENKEEWQKQFDSLKQDYKKFEDYVGKLSDKTKLLECLKLWANINQRFYRVYAYAHFKNDEDAGIDSSVAMMSNCRSLMNLIYSSCAFMDSEISALDESFLNQVVVDPEFSDFDFYISELKRHKKHILSDKEEKLLALTGKPLSGFQNAFMMFESMDLPLPKINVRGEKVRLTTAKCAFYLFDKDRVVRRAVFKGMYGAYKSMINTITALYSSSVASDNFYATAKGFDSALEKALFTTGIPKAVYENLVESVNNNTKVLHKYIALRKKLLNADRLHMYDMHTSLIENVNISYTYEESYDLVLKALKPLGEDYLKTVLRAKEERWIDVHENEGKRGGAYAFGVFDAHPYILLNHSGTTHDTFTLIHELGHAMHSYYSAKAQPFTKHHYEIFLAEIASIVNEVLLLKYMLSTAKDKKLRAYLLSYYLDMFRTTMFRQTMFAEFEMLAHKMDSEGTPLTVKSLSDTYYQLNKKYYGKSVIHDHEIRYEWARIPHFYNAFYVYQYSTGLVSAINVAQKILSNPEYVNTYKERFLCAGGSKNAYEILCSIGVDLASPIPFESASKEFSDTLKEFKRVYHE